MKTKKSKKDKNHKRISGFGISKGLPKFTRKDEIDLKEY